MHKSVTDCTLYSNTNGLIKCCTIIYYSLLFGEFEEISTDRHPLLDKPPWDAWDTVELRMYMPAPGIVCSTL